MFQVFRMVISHVYSLRPRSSPGWTGGDSSWRAPSMMATFVLLRWMRPTCCSRGMPTWFLLYLVLKIGTFKLEDTNG